MIVSNHGSSLKRSYFISFIIFFQNSETLGFLTSNCDIKFILDFGAFSHLEFVLLSLHVRKCLEVVWEDPLKLVKSSSLMKQSSSIQEAQSHFTSKLVQLEWHRFISILPFQLLMIAQAVLRKLESTKLLIMTFSLFLCIVTRQQMEKVCRYLSLFVVASLLLSFKCYGNLPSKRKTCNTAKLYIRGPNEAI